MEKEELLYQKIRDFLDCRMTPEDAAVFAAQIRADAQLMRVVDTVKLEMEMEKAIFDNALAEQMKEWDEQDFVPPGPSRPPSATKWYWLALLSVIAITLAVAMFFWMTPFTPAENATNDDKDKTNPPAEKTQPAGQDSDTLKQQDPSPPAKTRDQATAPSGARPPGTLIAGLLGQPVTGIGNVRGDAPASPLAEGAESYKNGDFKIAFSQWQQVARENEDYRGYAQQCMVYAALQKALQATKTAERNEWLDTAITLSGKVLNDPDNEQVIPATKWALLLAYFYRDGSNGKNFRQLLPEVAKQPGFEDRVEELKQGF